MKDNTNKLGMFGATPPPARDERKKLLVMTGTLVVLLSLFLFNRMSNKSEAPAPPEPQITTKIKLPELHSAELDALVKDKTEAGRSTLEPAAVELALEDASRLAAPHYDAMETAAVDEAVVEELEADPSAARMRPLRLRGYILSMRTRTLPGGDQYYTGLMVLDDSTAAHFAVSRLADESLDIGSAVRVDGLFVKLLREEADGTAFEGPLVAGREMVRSFPALYTENGNHAAFTASDLANIQDDDIDHGVGTLPFEQKWKLMARAAHLEPGDIDWDTVPVLDAATLSDMLNNGPKWQGQPIRLPLDGAALMTSTTRPAGENPARLELYSEGWLADNSWINLAPAIEFLAPFGLDIPDQKDPTVLGRGFVFKNLAYRSSGTGVRLTPVLVLSELQLLQPADEYIYGYILAGVAGISIILGAGIFLLLRRDKKASLEFQQQRRERARQRQRAAGAN